MQKLTITVGTTSTQKIGYLKDVLNELKIKAIIKPIDVKSGVSDQPITTTETKKGSINRAKASLRETKEADFALGIEVGYHKYSNNKFEIFCWVTIIDRHGHRVSSQSHRFILPEYHQSVLNRGKYLGDHLDNYSKEVNDEIGIYLDEMIRFRKPFIMNALRDTLLKYLKREDF
jgi:non-canonical (house-cleaning) NTP pyrophosphatase